nr:hypothetical protein [Hyphomonas sp. KY3]
MIGSIGRGHALQLGFVNPQICSLQRTLEIVARWCCNSLAPAVELLKGEGEDAIAENQLIQFEPHHPCRSNFRVGKWFAA